MSDEPSRKYPIAGPQGLYISLAVMRAVRSGGLIALVVAAALLALGYRGREIPFLEMRTQHADSTGYRPLPHSAGALHSVPRSGVEEPLPALSATSLPVIAALRNPLGSHALYRVGKDVYKINCAMCHGKSGHGDGPVGESYVPRPPDLVSARVRQRTDGELFYSITEGILSTPVSEASKYTPSQWHSFRDDLSAAERWEVVAYVRTLGRQNATAR